ncbi:hypothetical protein BGY98DRAFT_1100302 [Russula aff. rugulosa BPL654]|nr:hypothetical protein BGY98DRAFT_1100302 [Russula aff. rugulosa BPL654]
MACLWALAAAALFLAGTLGSSWFAVLEALQNTAYVPTTRPAWSGTRWYRHGCWYAKQTTAHPLLADVDSESVQASIQRLFDTGIMRTLPYAMIWYILQVELGDGQSGIDVGAGAGTVEGVLDVEAKCEHYQPCHSLHGTV